MSKEANAGELRTPVIVEAFTDTTDSDGYKSKAWANVFGDDQTLKVKWVNAHGVEVYESMRLELREPATLTARFSPLITPECRILKAVDANKEDAEQLYYEIISLDNVEDRDQWLEIKVQRMVKA